MSTCHSVGGTKDSRINFITEIIMEGVALSKLSLLLKILKQNTQALQLFSNIIKTESIYQKLFKCQAGRLEFRDRAV